MSQIKEFEEQIRQAEEMVELRDAVLKLTENRQFRKVFREKFFVEECARYAQLSADPALSKEDRENSLALAQAAGHVKKYLSVTIQMGNTAEGQLPEMRENLLAMINEESA